MRSTGRSAGETSQLDLSAVQPGLEEGLVQPVLPDFQIERALRDAQFLGGQGEVTVATRDRRTDGVALDRFQIDDRRRMCRDGALRDRLSDRGSDLGRKVCEG